LNGPIPEAAVRKLFTLILSILSSLILAGICQSQNGAPLARMEHQTRAENVCMLVLKDGRYHMERTITGRAQVFDGTLGSSALTELDPLLNANALVELKQSQIESIAGGEDIDQVMITIARPNGTQTLTFPSSKSRKPFKSEIDPILKWLDRKKQQQNPIPNAMSTRCMPPQNTQVANGLTTPSASNPYMMRILVDLYEPKGSGTALSSVSQAKGTTGQTVGGVTNTDAMDVNSFKFTRTCAVVYDSGRYRFERSVRESGIVVKTEIFRDTLDKTQLAGLRGLLDNPTLAALPSNTVPAFFGREGEFTSLTIPRNKGVQAVNVATFPPRNASADLREAAYQALGTNAPLTNPIRKWVKQNVTERKSAQTNDIPATTCIPSAQPE
jgi:hypothetical protein